MPTRSDSHVGAQDQRTRGEVSHLVLLNGVEVCGRRRRCVKSAEIGLGPDLGYHDRTENTLVKASFARGFLRPDEAS